MLFHYWKMAFRQLLKNKIQSLVKITGLALGLAGALLVLIVNYSESTWDGFWKDAGQIYKFEAYDGTKALSGFTPAILAETLRELAPEIDAVGRLQRSIILVQLPNPQTKSLQSFNQSVTRIDDSILDIFSLSETKGSLASFRNNPGAVIISESTSKKYFGDADPLGKQVAIRVNQLEGPSVASREVKDDQKLYTIVAVIADVSSRSNEYYHFIIPYHEKQTNADKYWSSRSLSTYVKLKNDNSLSDIENRLNEYIKRQNAEQKIMSNVDTRFKSIPIQKVHTQGANISGGKQQIRLLYVLGALVLFITLVNHMNLSVSSYLQRKKELALRRLVGAQRVHLFLQMWVEAQVYLLLAGLLSFILLEPVLPFIANNLAIRLDYSLLLEGSLFVTITGLFFVASLLIAVYPVLRTTKFSLARVLHANAARDSPTDTRVRKVFYLLQLIASSVLVASVIIVNAQLESFRNFDPGYNTDSIYFFHGQQFLNANIGQFTQLKNRLEENPAVQSVVRTRRGVLGSQAETGFISTMDQDKTKAVQIAVENIPDFNVLRMFQIPLLAGELPLNGDKLFAGAPPMPANAANEVVICEDVLPLLGFANAQEALHQTVKLYMGDFGTPMKVIAVTGKFHFGEFYLASSPCVFWQVQFGNAMSWGIRFKDADLVQTNSYTRAETYIKKVWQEVMGGTPYIEPLNSLVEASVGREKILRYFLQVIAAIAMVISVLGLYGLVQLTLQKRQLELALRKLHGASTMQVLSLLNREFSALALVANIIALPATIYFASHWLENFYQPINVWLWIPIAAAISVGLTILLTQITVTLQAISVARKRPVQALTRE